MDSCIGGYFSLELHEGEEYHSKAIKLNSARNCLEYILRAKKYKKVYIPYYTCEVLLEPLHKCNIKYEFYHINELLEPVETFDLHDNEALLYTNYYGLKQNQVQKLAKQYGKQLIVDNAQAFFAKPLHRIDTIYSPRKFVGVPDGAYLYTDTRLEDELPQDYSCQRMMHLLKRIDMTAQDGYNDFKQNDESLVGQSIKQMSTLTAKILSSIDYETIKKRRLSNYRYLDAALRQTNELHLELQEDQIPMVYPYFIEDDALKQRLISNKINEATYWPNVFN